MSGDWETKYRALRDRFAAMAAGEFARAAAVLEGTDRMQAGAIAELRGIFHKVGGSAGSCGFGELSRLSFDAELVCRSLLERGADPDADDADRLRRAVARLAAELEAARARAQPRASEPSAVATMKILVIDDDGASRLLAKSALESLGCMTVVEAACGKDGARIAREEAPDCILLDSSMPDWSGPETLAALRADAETSDIPVLFLTGVWDGDELESLASLGTRGIIRKPFEPKRLADQVRDAAKGRAGDVE